MKAAAHARLDHVDGLRGLAALAVLYQHLGEYLGNAAPAGSWARLHAEWTLSHLDLGKLGVVIFFAISGYIVPFSFGSSAPRLRFVVSRFFRLYPAYWVSLAVAACCLPLLGAPAFPTRQLLANLTMVQSLFRQPDVLGVYWTLLIELLFYGLCFALFCLGRLRSTPVLATLCCVMLAIAIGASFAREAGHNGAPVGLPLYLAVMLFGTCMRLATLEHDALAQRLCTPLLLVLLVAIPLAWSTAYDDDSHRESVLADVMAFDIALLLFVFAIKARVFAARPLIYAGAISYSVYLFHPVALEVAEHAARNFAWPAAGWVLVAVALLLTFAVSHLVYHVVERPSVRFGKQVMSTLSRRVAPA